MGRGLKGIILGGAIGAAIGILYAPRAGKKTRALLAEKTEALWGEEAQKKGTIFGEVAKTTKTAVEAGQSLINDAKASKFGDFTKGATAKGKKFAKETSEKVEEFTNENVRPVFSEKNDELRKKIDSAREKIASQVAKNIEDHKQDSVDVKPSAVKTKPVEQKKPKNSKKTKKDK